MFEKEKYDRAHKARHEENNQSAWQDLQDIANPLTYVGKVFDIFLTSEVERKAQRDADNDRYDPPE